MAVECIKKYRQLNGIDVLKVILKPTQRFPDGYFYCDSCDEKLIRNYTWGLDSQKHPYVKATCYGRQTLRFHREKAFNEKGYYPDCINHINGIEFDNIKANLDEVTNQQNQCARPSRGYKIAGRSFEPLILINSRHIWAKCTRTEVEAIQYAYQLELQYEDYRYDFLKDRRKDTDILDLERTGQIYENEAIYHHVCRHAKDNAWYVYRYNLFDYFKDNHIPIPVYTLDSQGYMVSPVTGKKLCPFQ